jgi:hypothetical protein
LAASIVALVNLVYRNRMFPRPGPCPSFRSIVRQVRDKRACKITVERWRWRDRTCKAKLAQVIDAERGVNEVGRVVVAIGPLKAISCQ